MTTTKLSVIPTKCTTCASLTEAPFACADCHALAEHVAGADYFELFSLPRAFPLDLATLERKYLSICRNVHPDAVAGQSDEMQALALRLSASINRAYDTLRQPLRRAEYLLETSGGRSAAQDKRVPPDLLTQVMTLREEMHDARADGDADRLAAILDGVRRTRAATEARIATLTARLDDADPALRDELRAQLNAVKYYDNLLAGGT